MIYFHPGLMRGMQGAKKSTLFMYNQKAANKSKDEIVCEYEKLKVNYEQ